MKPDNEEGSPSQGTGVARSDDTLIPTVSDRPPPLVAESSRPPGRASMASRSEVRPTLVSLSDMRPSLVDVRRTLLSILPAWKPRWRPWSPARVVSVTLGFAAFCCLVVIVGRRVPAMARLHPIFAPAPAHVAEDQDAPAPPAFVAQRRADARLDRQHRSPVAGGLLIVPPSFASEGGAYDLVVHFHGNTDLVEESYATSKLNAVIVILNLGNGSGPYEDRFANPMQLPELLDRAQATMEKRGLQGAKRRRLALTAWSAGYGAALKVLEQPDLAAQVDAVLLLDGIHVGYRAGSRELWLDRLAPFTRFAREAMEGKKLLSIAHSSITPIGDYAGTRETTDALLREVGVTRTEGHAEPPLLPLRSIEGVIAKKRLVALKGESVADRGGLHVHGYLGDQPEHHIAHLVQMSSTALPDLVARWHGSQ